MSRLQLDRINLYVLVCFILYAAISVGLFFLLGDSVAPGAKFAATIILSGAALFCARAILYHYIASLRTAIEEVQTGQELSATAAAQSHDYEFEDSLGHLIKIRQKIIALTESLRQCRRLQKAYHENSDDMVMIVDTDFKILWANTKAMEVHGKDTDHVLVGNFCYRVSHHRNDPCPMGDIVCPVAEARTRGETVRAVHVHHDAKGFECTVQMVAIPMTNQKGEIDSFLYISRDISKSVELSQQVQEQRVKLEEYRIQLESLVRSRTEQLNSALVTSDARRLAMLNMLEDLNESHEELAKATKEWREAQASLIQAAKISAAGQMAEGVAQEITNPLTNILSNIQLIKMAGEMKGDSKLGNLTELLSAVEQSALRCKNITESLMDFSDAGKRPYQPVDLSGIIEKALQVLTRENKLVHIKLVKDFASGLPLVLADASQMQQVIVDVLNNALWAVSGKTDPCITLRMSLGHPDSRIVLEIQDNGIGISREDLSHIFEPFFTTKKGQDAAGLGLAVSRGIIKEHRGMIEAYSQGLDTGTVIKITLPVVER